MGLSVHSFRFQIASVKSFSFDAPPACTPKAKHGLARNHERKKSPVDLVWLLSFVSLPR